MSLYIRHHQPGGTYFFTVNLAQRHRSLLTENIDTLRAVFREVRSRHPFQVKAIVILPEHLHCLWRLRLAMGTYQGQFLTPDQNHCAAPSQLNQAW